MDSTGSGIPLYFMMQKYFMRILFGLGVVCTAAKFIPESFDIKIKDLKISVINGHQYVYYLTVFIIMIYVEIFLRIGINRIEHRICKK